MSDHAKFYADIDANPGDWLAVDSFGFVLSASPNGDLVSGINYWMPSGLSIITKTLMPKTDTRTVTRNGIKMHWRDTLWQVPQPTPELTNEQRLVIYCAARDVQRGKSVRHRGEQKRLLALAYYALVFGTPEQHRSMCDKAERHRISADRFGDKADFWNRRACVIRKRIK